MVTLNRKNIFFMIKNEVCSSLIAKVPIDLPPKHFRLSNEMKSQKSKSSQK